MYQMLPNRTHPNTVCIIIMCPNGRYIMTGGKEIFQSNWEEKKVRARSTYNKNITLRLQGSLLEER